MNVLLNQTKRNVKLFFKDKGAFFASLITPIILLILFATFLRQIYRDSFVNSLRGFTLDDKMIDGFVGGELISSLLAVSCVTVAFCSNMIMVSDKVSGVNKDFMISPIKHSTLAFSYYLGTFINTIIVSFVALILGMIYLAIVGWFLSFTDILLIIVDVFLLTMFGTALSSIINFFLSTQGQISAIATIISSAYGFICGAYMPMSSYPVGLRNFVMFLPGTYGTSLIRNHCLNGGIKAMLNAGIPAENIEMIKNSVDCNLYFFENKVSILTMYLVLTISIVVLIAIYVLMNIMKGKKSK